MIKDGTYYDLPEQDYHDDPALGSSDIVNLTIDPGEYWANSHFNPNRPPDTDTDTDATSFGRILHNAFLFPGRDTFTTKPQGVSFATKYGKQWKADALERGDIILTDEQSRTMTNCAMVLREVGVVAAIGRGKSEVSHFWTGKDGIRRKIRIDSYSEDAPLDLKFYANQMHHEPDVAVARQIASYRYHIKAVWYADGLVSMGHEAGFSPIYVFVDKSAPIIRSRRFSERTSGGDRNEYWIAARNQINLALTKYRDIEQAEPGSLSWMQTPYIKNFADEDFGSVRWIMDAAEWG